MKFEHDENKNRRKTFFFVHCAHIHTNRRIVVMVTHKKCLPALFNRAINFINIKRKHSERRGICFIIKMCGQMLVMVVQVGGFCFPFKNLFN